MARENQKESDVGTHLETNHPGEEKPSSNQFYSTVKIDPVSYPVHGGGVR